MSRKDPFPCRTSLLLPSLVRRLASALAVRVLLAGFWLQMVAGEAASRGLVGNEPVQESAFEDRADWPHLAFAAGNCEQRASSKVPDSERKCARREVGFDWSSVGGEEMS